MPIPGNLLTIAMTMMPHRDVNSALRFATERTGPRPLTGPSGLLSSCPAGSATIMGLA